MPALVKMTIEPIVEGMAFGIEIGVEVVHHLALALYIIQQVFITYCPGVQTLMGGQLAERGRGVGDDRVDGADLIDGIEFGLVINGALIGPIDIGSEGGVGLLEMEMLGAHPIRPIDGCGSTYA